ncbi:putative major facilitator superfamily transporter protein [Rosellinia necatrix]|uniref:Putative major facilitator superfamily transporter protein n=1 Tax=Rosellinia necatrix TaxID=77044 RepID=A0A1W2THA1_ROSNE|nr:putative major facilitator superfamily transporter protein [Rosellinia necatrix]
MPTVTGPLRWFYHEFGLASVHATGRNAYLIILARTCRMFAYGTNSLILAIFFSALGVSDHQIGLFMTLTLVGDVFLGTLLSLVADRIGRRRVLMAGSVLMITSGVTFAIFENFWILLLGAIVGVISITGGDFGPFRSIEESVLSQLTTPTTRSDVLAWHVSTPLIGSSLGSEVSGRVLHWLQGKREWSEVDSYHALFYIYAAMGFVNLALVALLTEACELKQSDDSYTQIPQEENETLERPSFDAPELTSLPSEKSNRLVRAWTWLSDRLAQISAPTRATMYKLWFLLAVDSLADGMVPYSLTNYYLDLTFHPSKSTLGDVTSASYFLGALGATLAGPLAKKIGLVNTMVFTHIPSSAAVLVFPFPPYFWMAAALLLIRAALNSMDQAPRTALIAAVVKPQERTAVMGITSTVRTLAAMAGPTVTGLLASSEHFWAAFVAAGVCRLAYDFGLYGLFINIKLDQHSTTPNATAPSDPIERGIYDEETGLENLFDSDLSSISGSETDSQVEVIGGLQPPSGREHQRARSRSPHRMTDDDAVS